MIIISSSFLFSNNNEKAPTFYLRTLDNNDFFLSEELERGNPIILSFFATWCAPCKKEMPIIDSLALEYDDIDFYFVNVNGIANQPPETSIKIKELIKSLKINVTVLLDLNTKIFEKYNGKVLPRTIVINSSGNIVYQRDGYKKGDEIELIQILDGFTNDDE